jgi:hypothetical protein
MAIFVLKALYRADGFRPLDIRLEPGDSLPKTNQFGAIIPANHIRAQ